MECFSRAGAQCFYELVWSEDCDDWCRTCFSVWANCNCFWWRDRAELVYFFEQSQSVAQTIAPSFWTLYCWFIWQEPFLRNSSESSLASLVLYQSICWSFPILSAANSLYFWYHCGLFAAWPGSRKSCRPVRRWALRIYSRSTFL